MANQARHGGNELSSPCPTLDALVELGFERRQPRGGAETVGYSFVHFDVVGRHGMNRFGRYVVLISGVRHTERTISIIDIEIPSDLESVSEAAGWISFALRSHRSELVEQHP